MKSCCTRAALLAPCWCCGVLGTDTKVGLSKDYRCALTLNAQLSKREAALLNAHHSAVFINHDKSMQQEPPDGMLGRYF